MAKAALGSWASLPARALWGRLQIQDPTRGSTAPERRKKPGKPPCAPAASLIPCPPHPLGGPGWRWGCSCCPIVGSSGRRGFSARLVSGEAEESAQCPNRSIQSLLKITKCAPGEGGDAGCPGSGPRWQPGPVPPIELRIPHPGPAAWHGAPGPHGDTRPRSQRVGTTPGQQGRPRGCHCGPGAPRGWRSCGRALARCPSADGNRARCYRQWSGRRRTGWRMPGAGGAAGAAGSGPSPPSRAAGLLLVPQLCQPRAGHGRGSALLPCLGFPWHWLGGERPPCLAFRGHTAPAPSQVSLRSSGCPWPQ